MSHVPPDLALMPAIELSGVFVGALSGGLAAVRKQFDLFGILVLAWATGLGGGMLRDVVIGVTPPVGIADWRFMTVACLAGVVMYLFNPRLERARRMILVLDAGALALFSVSGTLKALELGVGAVAAVSAGLLTAVGGGVLRDLLTAEVPVVLHQRQLYAVPAVLGAVLTAVLWVVGALSVVTATAAIGVVFALRVAALRFRLQAPGPWTGVSWPRKDSGAAGGPHRLNRLRRVNRLRRPGGWRRSGRMGA